MNTALSNENVVDVDLDESEVDSQKALQNELESLSKTEQHLQQKQRLIENQLAEIASTKKDVLAKLMRLRTSRVKTNVGKTYEADEVWTRKFHEVAKSYFGITKFRDNQLATMNSILMKLDTMLVMPTGGGKSLCFQVPTVSYNVGLTVVISPLISLMTDQVMSLRSVGINALMASSSSSKEQASEVREAMKRLHKRLGEANVSSKSLRFIYVTPERIVKSKQFMGSLEKIYDANNLLMVVIDEVHCVSQWGHSFRQDYMRLNLLKQHFPTTPLLLLTATATPNVVEDIQKALNVPNCNIFRSHFNRPNLFYTVWRKPKDSEEVIRLIFEFVKCFPPSSAGIIYCLSRKDAQNVCDELRSKYGIYCAFYHAEMDAETRHQVHEHWTSGKIQIVVATIAFGMGINKKDVRFVIHHSLSKSLENYYQESGRAGRDGLRAFCLVLYRPSDVFRHSVMVYWEQTGLFLLYKMVQYCNSEKACRRSLIAEHFHESQVECGAMCDRCYMQGSAKELSAFYDNSGPENDRQSSVVTVTENDAKRYKGKRRMPNSVSLVEDSAVATEAGKLNDSALRGAFYKLLEYLRSIYQDPDRKVTLLQLQTEWKRLLPEIMDFETSRSFVDAETMQAILVNLLVDGVLTEEFYHTPYATNSYLKLCKKGLDIFERMKRNALTHDENIKLVSTMIGGAPDWVMRQSVAAVMQLIKSTYITHFQLFQATDEHCVRTNQFLRSNHFKTSYEMLKGKVASLADASSVFPAFILEEEKIRILAEKCEDGCINNESTTLDAVHLDMSQKKLELYGDALLEECKKCASRIRDYS